MKAFSVSLKEDRGPVHLNFPFKKPLEPFSYTDEINKSLFNLKPQRFVQHKSESTSQNPKIISSIADKLINQEKGIIIAGPMESNNDFCLRIKKLSTLLKYPIFADGLSQLRFRIKSKNENVLSNFNSYLRSESFIEENEPEIILQFGRTPTSSTFENFLLKTGADRYIINSYGDKFDPTQNAKMILSIDPNLFCENILSQLGTRKFSRKKLFWLNNFIRAEEICEELKLKRIQNKKGLNEPSAISEIINCLPSGCNIFIGNSLPVRDLDNFFTKTSKRMNVYFNRGASGIDGITSTALGMAIKKRHAVLLTGDLSFMHDLGALSIASKYSIPLMIIIINNNGGGIFESLPIANKVSNFEEYFITPHNLELSDIVNSFNINYHLISSRSQLKNNLLKCLKSKLPCILEIKTNATRSAEIRKSYFEEVNRKLSKKFKR